MNVLGLVCVALAGTVLMFFLLNVLSILLICSGKQNAASLPSDPEKCYWTETKRMWKICGKSRVTYPIKDNMVFVNMQVCSGTQSGKALHEKHILSLIPFIPKLILQVAGYWKSRTLQVWLILFWNYLGTKGYALAISHLIFFLWQGHLFKGLAGPLFYVFCF